MLFQAIKEEIEKIDKLHSELDHLKLCARRAMKHKQVDEMVDIYQKLKEVTDNYALSD